MRTAILLCALALAGCGGVPKAPPAVRVTPAPLAPDPRICAALEAEPDVRGGIVQPRTQEARDAVQAFLNGEIDLLFWGRRGWSRAELAQAQYCRR